MTLLGRIGLSILQTLREAGAVKHVLKQQDVLMKNAAWRTCRDRFQPLWKSPGSSIGTGSPESGGVNPTASTSTSKPGSLS